MCVHVCVMSCNCVCDLRRTERWRDNKEGSVWGAAFYIHVKHIVNINTTAVTSLHLTFLEIFLLLLHILFRNGSVLQNSTPLVLSLFPVKKEVKECSRNVRKIHKKRNVKKSLIIFSAVDLMHYLRISE